MKKKYKISLGILFIIVISITGGYYWLINGWRKFISEKELSSYTSEIKKHTPLSNEFKDIYYKLHPKEKEATLTKELIEKTFKVLTKSYSSPSKNCSCDDIIYYDRRFINRTFMNNLDYDPLRTIKLGYGLEKYLSNEECLNYSIRLQFEEIKNTKDGYSFAGKEFDNLNRHDIIDFLIAVKGTVNFSPLRYSKRYREKKQEIESML